MMFFQIRLRVAGVWQVATTLIESLFFANPVAWGRCATSLNATGRSVILAPFFKKLLSITSRSVCQKLAGVILIGDMCASLVVFIGWGST